MRDSLEAAQVLLELGADKSAKNKDGMFPVHFAGLNPAAIWPPFIDPVLPDYDQRAGAIGSRRGFDRQPRVAELFKSE